jgi:type I site-specific restriction-modification system R (restriction) subunit
MPRSSARDEEDDRHEAVGEVLRVVGRPPVGVGEAEDEVRVARQLGDLRIVGGQTLDALFDRMFSDRTEEERAEIKKRYANDMAVAGAPKRIEAICLDLLDHFSKYIAPNGFKAQVVAVSRDVAVTYKETSTG